MSQHPTKFAWWPVRLFEMRQRGVPEWHWPHPCWVETGEIAWLCRVQFCDNVITGERHHFRIGAQDYSRPLSETMLKHWRSHGLDC